MSEKVVLSIDGKQVTAKPGERLIDVAKREGTYIPRFCYHPKLSVVASCRMCLVDIEGMGKAQPACATLVTNDMIVKTQSKKAIEAQKAIMQFLLINHPLHCPICDQGGECELQDSAMGYGEGVSEYVETKRVTADENLGPLVATDMSLCIHCTRCVRFGKEIAGIPDLGFVGRGDRSQIGTYLQTGLKSELSGNMIDLCPVGALTSKPFKFKGRSWGFKQHRGVSVHDCIGSNVNYHTIAKGYDHLSDIMRVIPAYHEALNENWLSDRDRFSYEGIQAEERLLTPKIKVGDRWEEISWEDVLSGLMSRLSQMTIDEKKDMGVWLSNQMTLEEAYLAQHVFRKHGVDNIDYRLWENIQGSNDILRPSNISLTQLKSYNKIILIGVNVRYDQPILSLSIQQALSDRMQVISIGSIDYPQIFSCKHHLVSPQVLAQSVLDLTEPKDSGGVVEKDDIVLYLLGEEALVHLQSQEIQQIIHHRCLTAGHDYIVLPPGPNSIGMSAAGCLPYQSAWSESKCTGLSFQQMLDKPQKTYWLHQVDPMLDVADPKKAYMNLKNAFVIAVTSYDTTGIRDCADIMLPLAAVAESPGSYVNYQGLLQSFSAATCPRGEAKQGWTIYQVLASLLSIDAPKNYESLNTLVSTNYHETQWQAIESYPLKRPEALKASWLRIGLASWVRGDMQVRHAKALQEAYPIDQSVYVHAEDYDAIQLHLSQAKVSKAVAKGAIVYERGQVFYNTSMGEVTVDEGVA